MTDKLDHSMILFQSTHSQGVRLKKRFTACFDGNISIHALTRSATSGLSGPFLFGLNFNPRTHKECDLIVKYHHQRCTIFQSTHSQGVRQFLSRLLGDLSWDFNPRTHKECDNLRRTNKSKRHNFNPRTHKECDAKELEDDARNP